jgi:hypothetical protein
MAAHRTLASFCWFPILPHIRDAPLCPPRSIIIIVVLGLVTAFAAAVVVFDPAKPARGADGRKPRYPDDRF